MQLEREYPLDESFKIVESIACDRNMLRAGNIEIIGQFNEEFIWCRLRQPSVLLCFDQHAVHERIRYDRLLKEAVDANDGRHLITRALQPPYEMSVPIHHRILIQKAGHCIEQIFGLGLSLLPFLTSISAKSIKVAVSRVPIAFTDFEHPGAFNDYLEELATWFQIENDNVQLKQPAETIKALTPFLVNQLRTRACRGAIRFGERLSSLAQEELIKALSICRMPFRCAHGRYLIMTGLKIPSKEEEEIINLQKLQAKFIDTFGKIDGSIVGKY